MVDWKPFVAQRARINALASSLIGTCSGFFSSNDIVTKSQSTRW